ncbi:S-adenosyl-L-methionine-dependent methyltransferase [Cantharellus anzutake]|uniref:S-adenosyl-L-methionine-dependent methyltransferase n=1 Tax=Cantharellus anzutake TaxID=1750568 RepID=UPI001906CA80|nr:S-adenosyl-L-methionine-dependent methyltransferase [Cantharellus anzutake]KAF8341994.1 S-adenosyl-L-methionine-dependent methyltransferase [Cantharellus anzutake]
MANVDCYVRKEGDTPWNDARITNSIQLALEKLQVPRTGHVLVPGCGKGDDVIYFATEGFKTLGIDISHTAIEKGKREVESRSLNPSKVALAVDNFFDLESPEGGYDIIYDFTFFCALPPSTRPMWGSAVNRLIQPTGGLLIATVWPIDRARPTGPPYSVSVDDYSKSLGSGWKIVLNEDPPNLDNIHAGRTRVVVWKSER